MSDDDNGAKKVVGKTVTVCKQCYQLSDFSGSSRQI